MSLKNDKKTNLFSQKNNPQNKTEFKIFLLFSFYKLVKHLIMKFFYLSICLIYVGVAPVFAQKTYYVGHSLINLNVPYMTNLFAKSKGINNANYKHHINIGTALRENWLDTNFNGNLIWDSDLGMDVEHGSNHFVELQNPYQHIVITEAVPLLEQNRDTTVKYATNFFNYARNYKPTIKKYLYTSWEPVVNNDWNSWRQSLTNLQSHWENIATETQNNLGTGNQVFIIPANIALRMLYDTLQLHNIGTLSNISQLFSDNIHFNAIGNYFISCVMLSAVYQQNPLGLGIVQAGPYTSEEQITDAVLRQKLQQIAWSAVCNYPRAGLNCALSGTTNISENTKPIVYYANNILTIQNINDFKQFEIFDINGKSLYIGNANVTNISLPKHQILNVRLTRQNNTFTNTKIIVSH